VIHGRDEDAPYDGPSKSQRKREMHMLQDLGERLVALPPSQLERLELPSDLVDAALMCSATLALVQLAAGRQPPWAAGLRARARSTAWTGAPERGRLEQRRGYPKTPTQ
jgi:hypothetical protein